MSASIDKLEDEKGRDTQSALDEKRPASELSSEIYDGDEALQLVGAERTAQFSEEYNLKLRRKLVSSLGHPGDGYLYVCFRQDGVIIPICAAVYFTQFLDKTSLNYARYVFKMKIKHHVDSP
jgi:MFS transporter, ACS family, DAL5 transporter family protein